MTEKLYKILLKTYNNTFVLVGILILLLAGAAYFLLGKGAADALIEQMLHREQAVSRAGAISIGVFLDSLRNQVSSHATREGIRSFDSQVVPKDLEILLDRWKNTPVSVVILANKKGVVEYGLDREGNKIAEVDVSDREYFKWAEVAKDDETFVGEPVQGKAGFAKGRYVIPIASPVFKDGHFNGVFVVSFLLDEISSKYLDTLRISDNTRIYLIDAGGVVISGPVQQLIGINYLDYLDKSVVSGNKETIQTLRDTLASESDGKLDIVLPNEQKKATLTRYLIAYSPILVGQEHWIIAIATPATDALEFLAPFYFKGLILAGFAILGFVVIAVRISKILGYKEGIETEHKFHSDTPTPES